MNQEKGSTNNRGNFPCSKCRKMLPAGTAVCPYCMEAQDTAREVVIPGSRKKIWIGAGLVLAAVMIALIAFLSPKKPKVYDNGTDTVQYKDYKLILSANNYESDPYSHLEIFCTRGDNAGYPMRIYAFDKDGELQSDAFREEVDTVTAEFVRLEGEGDIILEDLAEESVFYHPDAVRAFNLGYFSNSGKADLVFTVTMKTGEEIILHGDIDVTETPLIEFVASEGQENMTPTGDVDNYYWKMDTVQDVQDLLDQIDGGKLEQTNQDRCSIMITLKPIVYTGDLHYEDYPISICGTGEDEQRTTLVGSMSTRSPEMTGHAINNIIFRSPEEGKGSGLTLYGYGTVRMCVFQGYETGLIFRDRGWAYLQDDRFENNRTGLLIDADVGGGWSNAAYNNTFQGNETAVIVERTKVDSFTFNGCIFSDNGTDLVNNTEAEYIIN